MVRGQRKGLGVFEVRTSSLPDVSVRLGFSISHMI